MKKKILWISDGINIASGYGNQSNGILNGLKEEYDCYNMSFQYHGQPIVLNGITLLPNGWNMWGDDIIEHHLKSVQPDYVMVLMDLFRPAKLLKQISELKKKYGGKWITYFPLDARPLPWDSEEVFKAFDYRIAMADFGKEVLEEALPDAPVIRRIWHGTDTEVFKPIDNFQKDAVFSEYFVFGSVFRNCIRKNPGALLFAFYKLHKKYPLTKLFLHTDPNDSQGANIGGLVKRLNLNKHIVFTNFHSVFYSLPPDKLNQCYNIMDCHVLASTGEGFGIPLIESFAAGKPNIMTDYTTAKELIGDHRGLRVPYIKGITTQCTYLTERAYIDTDLLVNAMEQMYLLGEEGVKEKYQKKCRQFAIDNFDWNKVIIPQWKQLMKEIEDGKV